MNKRLGTKDENLIRDGHIHPLCKILKFHIKFQRLCNLFESHLGGSVAKFPGESLIQTPLLLWEHGLTFCFCFFFFFALSNLAMKAGGKLHKQESIPTTIFLLPQQSLIWAEPIWGKKKFEPNSWTQKIDS